MDKLLFYVDYETVKVNFLVLYGFEYTVYSKL